MDIFGNLKPNNLVLSVFFGGIKLVGGWTNPFEKYAQVKLDHFFQGSGMNIKNVWVATTYSSQIPVISGDITPK